MVGSGPSRSDLPRDVAYSTAAWWYGMAWDRASSVRSWSRAHARFWERTPSPWSAWRDADESFERAAADTPHDMERNEKEARAAAEQRIDETMCGDIAFNAMRQGSQALYDVSVSVERSVADVLSAWTNCWSDIHQNDAKRSPVHAPCKTESAEEEPRRPQQPRPVPHRPVVLQRHDLPAN